MTKESVNGQWPSTLYQFRYVYVHLNMKAGVFKDFGVVLLQSKIKRFC